MNRILEERAVRHNGTVYHISDGYFYYLRRVKTNRSSLSCILKRTNGCPGMASMPSRREERTVESFRLTRNHDHPPNNNWLDIQRLRSNILQRCRNEATNFRQIHREEASRFAPDVAAHVPFIATNRSMYRARMGALGAIPQTLEEYGATLENSVRFGQTIGNEEYYRATLVDGNGDVAVVFISPTLIELLPQSTNIHLDATFKVVPRMPPSRQLLTLSAISYDHAFPVVSVLMSSKTEALYDLVLTYIDQQVAADWSPTVVTTDFERGLQNAVRRCWPTSLVVGCWFHSANSMNKRIRRLGLSNVVRQENASRRVYKMCQALPLLPPESIPAGFAHILDYAQRNGVPAEMNTFLEYVERVWINGVGVNSFSVFNQRRRTNNDMESYHRKLRDTFNQAHPNIWIFNDGLRTLENEAVQTLHTLQQGHRIARRPRHANILANVAIANCTALLREGRYAIGEFLEVVSRQLDDIHNEVYNADSDESDEEEAIVGALAEAAPPVDEEVPGVNRDGNGRGRGQGQGRGRGRRRGQGRARGQARQGRGRGRGGRGQGQRRGQGRGRRPGVMGQGQGEALVLAANALAAAAGHVEGGGAQNQALAAAAQALAAVAMAAVAVPDVQAIPVNPAPALPNPNNPGPANPQNNGPEPERALVREPYRHMTICVVCQEMREIMMIFVPCGHVVVCQDCSRGLEDNDRCVVCRADALGLYRVR